MIFSDTCQGKRIIKIFNDSPEDSVKELKDCIQRNEIIPSEFNKATVFDQGAVDKSKKFEAGYSCYPLVFFAKDGSMEVWVSSVTFNHNSSKFSFDGNRYAITCLKLMEFKIYSFEERWFLDKPYHNNTYLK